MTFVAEHKSKAFGEKLVLLYSPFWIGMMIIVVIRKWYESFTPNDYLLFSIGLALPCLALPLIMADSGEKRIPLLQRYVVKANVYILVVGYLGNYFYTHYFYKVLGVKYTGPVAPGAGVDLNGVPLCMYFMTHVYFMSYHVLLSPLMRAVRSSFTEGSIIQAAALTVFVLAAAFTIAFAETWTISGFPYYTYPSFYGMLTKGSVFYGTFFVVTFPLFFRLDENTKDLWSMRRVVGEALAAMMLVIMAADLWRLVFLRYDGLHTNSVVIPND